MRALLLCAGIGTRLRPLTDQIPKCLVPIRGKPLLSLWLESLDRAGVSEIMVNLHYKAEMVRQYVETSRWRSKVHLVYEENLLGTGGTILANRNFLKDGLFLVGHGDNLTVFDPADFEIRHATRPAGCEITMMTFQTPTPESCGILELNAQSVVTKFHEKVKKPPSDLANAAVYMMEPSVIDFIASLGKPVVDLSTEVLPHYMGRIFTYHNSAYHRDIGTIDSWNQAQMDFPGL